LFCVETFSSLPKCQSDGRDLARRVLQDWVAERIGAYKRPRWIEFLPELPKTATGKLQRFTLRELQQDQNAAPPNNLDLGAEE
jgi:acyl-coenzyme A synthetase/AMP-(fatty) acid ligase